MAFITQGVFGGGKIVKYIDEVAGFWGFNICKGLLLTTPWGVRNPRVEYPAIENEKIATKIKQSAARYYNMLKAPVNPSPSMKRMLLFRLTRTAHKYSKEHLRDYEYFQNNGWFESDYFYEADIGVHKKLIGRLIDKLIGSQAKKG